jgi:hypothetical protein
MFLPDRLAGPGDKLLHLTALFESAKSFQRFGAATSVTAASLFGAGGCAAQ